MSTSNRITGYALSGGARLHFETCGDGPALVFIHAGVSDHRMWDPQVDFFAAKFNVIRYDLRGFGQSKFVDEPFSLRDDLLAVMRDLGIEKAALIGCSMGGGAAIDFTLEHPEMVTALVPVGAGVSGWNDWSPEPAIAQMTEAVKRGDVDTAFELSARFWIDGPTRDASRVEPRYREHARRLHRENFSLELFRHPEVSLDPPALNRLVEIKCPALVMIGDSDSQDLRKIAAHLSTTISGARIVTLANAAHLPSLEHPGQFNTVLQEFLNSI